VTIAASGQSSIECLNSVFPDLTPNDGDGAWPELPSTTHSAATGFTPISSTIRYGFISPCRTESVSIRCRGDLIDKATADATYELLDYLNSPIIDRAIETFHGSAAERALAAKGLRKYLSDAGLESSDRVKWELHDDNWCVDAQVTVTYHDDSGDPHPITVSGHYDSDTGFGTGVC
jgi:hypothetical protein